MGFNSRFKGLNFTYLFKFVVRTTLLLFFEHAVLFSLKEISLKRERAVANRCERQWNELDNNYVLYVLIKRISEAMLLFTVHDTLLPHLHLITSLYRSFALEVWLFCQQVTIVLLGFKEFNWLVKPQLQIFIILKRVLH